MKAMTSLLDTTTTDEIDPVTSEEPAAEAPSASPSADEPSSSKPTLTTGQLVALWIVIAAVILGIVLYLVEPMFQQREQGLLLERYRSSIDKAANQSTGLGLSLIHI